MRDFPRAAEIGGAGAFARLRAQNPAAQAKVGWLATTDLAEDMLANSPGPRLCADEERSPFADGVLDLIVAPLSLHLTNDLPGALIQARRALKPDGLFLAALVGGASLTELRQSLLAAESADGGAGPRVAPFADARDMAGLLQRAGFALPVADVDRHMVRYGSPLALLSDLRAMGETAALVQRPPRALTRGLLMRAMAHYQERFADPDGRVRATFEIVYAAGWAPADTQPKPLRPGSAKVRLADALGVSERSAGERAGPRAPGKPHSGG